MGSFFLKVDLRHTIYKLPTSSEHQHPQPNQLQIRQSHSDGSQVLVFFCRRSWDGLTYEMIIRHISTMATTANQHFVVDGNGK